MATYTMYWPDWMCDRAREQGLEGQPLRLLWGGHNQDTRFSRFKVGPGDVVVPVTCRGGVLYALAAMRVTEKTSAEAWLGGHPEDEALRMHGCGSELLVGMSLRPLRFDRPFTRAQLAGWRYDGVDGERPLKHLGPLGLQKTLSLRGVYRLTAQTAAVAAEVLAAEAPEGPRGTAVELEAALRASPVDEALARVLADAWQDAGEVRGELLALELDLLHEVDPLKAAALDARHASLMRQSGALKRRPGGFPYRMSLGGRPHVELSADGLSLAGGEPAAPLSDFSALARALLAVEGFSSIRVLREEGGGEAAVALRRRFEAVGAREVALLRWGRKRPFSLEETRALVGGAPGLVVSATGPVRAVDGGPPVPFQGASQWLGTPPKSELNLWLTDGSISLSLRVPEGSAVAAARVAALEALVRRLGGQGVRVRLVRGGARMVSVT